MSAYYNEIDPYAAQWIRNLIEAGLIAPGVVDERSIEDVKPDELLGFTQCHFFAGIGVWSLALRNAGWPDDRPVWTGSCPCQPFSSAGKGNGFDDERHLWPHFQWLIQQRRPPVVLGEQVASKDAESWIDLVHADVEAMGYAFGCIPFPSAGVGAPHIRDRSFWVGHSNSAGLERFPGNGHGLCKSKRFSTQSGGSIAKAGRTVWLADTTSIRCGSGSSSAEIQEGRQSRSDAGRELAAGLKGCAIPNSISAALRVDRSELLPGPVNGLWRNADWLHCRDGKWRPVESGTFPLANGIANRVGRLRAYGNAINAYQAQIFIESVMEIYE